ncbi:MAG: BolA family transcriptional regulator [Rhodocyclaceae bacterium]|nr:BolA family transcriptional regulator [Rhodocyclaceae bacterium]MBX3670530.1 BolA family transcriptional regulator [Rhodocyclaceae bacterium]
MQERLAVLAPLKLEIEDESARHAGHAGAAGGGHYRITIVAPAFAGASRLARHRMVYDALLPLMQHGIHALAITALSPDEAPN